MKTILVIKALFSSRENDDFVALLRQMYCSWATRHGHRVLFPEQPGPAADCLVIEGDELQSLQQEHGVHRLSRISPYDAQGRRHTTFCSVTVDGQSESSLKDGSVRSYVLAPVSFAQDYRTGKQTNDVGAVLDGHLELMW